jgi:hypothetical protein
MNVATVAQSADVIKIATFRQPNQAAEPFNGILTVLGDLVLYFSLYTVDSLYNSRR